MPGLDPGIHVLNVEAAKTWMAGTSPAMTARRKSFMHDIRSIRDNPDAFDRGSDAARTGAGSESG